MTEHRVMTVDVQRTIEALKTRPHGIFIHYIREGVDKEIRCTLLLDAIPEADRRDVEVGSDLDSEVSVYDKDAGVWVSFTWREVRQVNGLIDG